MNKPLTPTDLDELERMLAESGIGEPEDIERAKAESQGLGLFVRSLVGMDREAAKEAFGGLPRRQDAQREPDRVRQPDRQPPDRARRHGAALLYESPFTDITPSDPTGSSLARPSTS